MFEVQVNLLDIQELHGSLILLSDQLPGAAAAAVDDALEECRERVTDELESEFNAPREALAARVGRTPVKRPQRQFIEGKVFLKKKRLSLRLFKPVQHPLGVVYRPYTSGSARMVRHAFGPDIHKLRGGVFTRTTSKPLPIKKEDGLSLTDDPVAKAAVAAVESDKEAILDKHVDKHVGNLLDAINRGQVNRYGLIHVSQDKDIGEGQRYTGF